MAGNLKASIILSDMDRTKEASYGFLSWVLQDYEEPYEVILNLFNDKSSVFEALTGGRNSNCHCRIKSYPRPQFFNISAANNLGLARATGDYILFANSDVIYPSHFLRIFMNEIIERDLSYLLGARINLGERETRSLPDPSQIRTFDPLLNGPHFSNVSMGSPWTVRRNVARAIGGFDTRILCHEDSEFNDRVIHYLRRKRLQGFIYAASNLYGYHLHHGPSELYAISKISKAILEPRRERLLKDPNSQEDIIDKSFDDSEELLKDLYRTRAPSYAALAERHIGALGRRMKGAIDYLLRGPGR